MKLAVNCYARIKATRKVGRITNKFRHEGKITWGVAWSNEFPTNELERITPQEYHASPEHLKIVGYESSLTAEERTTVGLVTGEPSTVVYRTKLVRLAGASSVTVELLLEDAVLVEMIKRGDSQADCLAYINENF